MRKILSPAITILMLCGCGIASAQGFDIEIQGAGADAKAETRADANGGTKVRLLNVAPASAESQYAIGVALEELPEVVKEQLKLERGLVVINVLEKSPAAAAGIQKSDLILAAGGADVKSPADLVAAVTKAEMKPLALVILRGGKEQTIEVKPDAKTRFRVAVPGGFDLDVLTRTFEQALPGGGPPAAQFFQGGDIIRVHPGVMVGRLKLDALPAGVKLHITKEGDQPAKIVIEKGDLKWEGSEDKLNEAPEELQAIAKKALGREGRIEMAIESAPYLRMTAPIPVPPGVPAAQAEKIHAEIRRKLEDANQKVEAARRTVVTAPDGRVEAKLDAVLKRLSEMEEGRADKLQKQLDELREQLEALKKQK